MNLSHSRRLIATLATAGLLLSGLALASSASAEGPCPTYTDPADDAVVQGETTGETQDNNLDILAVSHSVDDGVFTTVLKMKGLLDSGANFSFYDRFVTTFTVAKKAIDIRVDRDNSGSMPVIVGSLRVAAVLTATKVTPVLDVKTSTVTLSVSVADLEKDVGASLVGEKFSLMVSRTIEPLTPVLGNPAVATLQPNLTIDTATAPATASYVFGGSCSGAAPPPGPVPTATPTTPPPPAAPSLFAFPRADCVLYKDAAGDAKPGSGAVRSPLNDSDLDFTTVAVKSAPDAVSVFAKVATLGTKAGAPFDGHRFTTSFVINGKTITATAKAAGAAVTTPTTAKATAVFDTAKGYVIFTFPTADLEAAAGAPMTASTKVTDVAWVSKAVSSQAGEFDGDTAAGTTATEKSYSYGDNTCFKPPVGLVTIDTTGRGVYSDRSFVDVTLTDADELPLEGAEVRLVLTGMPAMTLLTNEAGVAEFSFPVTVTAGNKTLSATFAGNPDVGPAGAGAPFTVAPDATVLKAVGGKGNVTATLTDNDKTPLARRVVVFKAGSKVTKVTTNAKGVAVLTRQTRGTSVSVSFAAVAGKYLAAKTVTAKVL